MAEEEMEVQELHTQEAQEEAGGSYAYASNAGTNGGAGGNANADNSSSWHFLTIGAGGGAGNPGGSGKYGYNKGQSDSGATGTGGLLVIYADTFENNATISANGSNGGAGYRAGGGRIWRRLSKHIL